MRFAAGERGRALTESDVAQADVEQGLQLACDVGILASAHVSFALRCCGVPCALIPIGRVGRGGRLAVMKSSKGDSTA